MRVIHKVILLTSLFSCGSIPHIGEIIYRGMVNKTYLYSVKLDSH